LPRNLAKSGVGAAILIRARSFVASAASSEAANVVPSNWRTEISRQSPATWALVSSTPFALTAKAVPLAMEPVGRADLDPVDPVGLAPLYRKTTPLTVGRGPSGVCSKPELNWMTR